LIQVKKELGLRMAAMNGRDVRFGSITAALPPKWRVRFTPKSCRDIRSPSRQLRYIASSVIVFSAFFNFTRKLFDRTFQVSWPVRASTSATVPTKCLIDSALVRKNSK
jgi:hypothetical protein